MYFTLSRGGQHKRGNTSKHFKWSPKTWLASFEGLKTSSQASNLRDTTGVETLLECIVISVSEKGLSKYDNSVPHKSGIFQD